MNDNSNLSFSESGHDIDIQHPPLGPRLIIEAVDSFNYAAWQNSVPVLRRIAIDNTDAPELSSLSVELHASSKFSRSQTWTVDRVRAGETLPLKNVDLKVDPEYLDGLNEAERVVLTFRVMQSGKVLHETDHVIRILARDEWGGMSGMGELLPAFVTPNDPALPILLRSAATLLGQHGYSTALDGYQSADPNRVYMLAASLWSAVAGRKLVYAMPPGSFEKVGQKTRRIETILNDGLATCLDTSLLFASGLEAMGLNPVLVMTQGHCFTGVWLVNKMFPRPVISDCVELRKVVTANEMIVFETTLVTNVPAARFPDAITTAVQAISEAKEHEFVAVIDVARGRVCQIRPLASHAARPDSPTDSEESGPPPLPALPGITTVITEEESERPQTPAGRIERWQRKLLDLSLRNRLLNFVQTQQTVPVLCPDVSQLEDQLADGARMKLVSLHDANPMGQRDAELHQKRTQKDIDLEFVSQIFHRGEVACPLDERELDSRLTALFRKVRNDLAEGGSNTLYLAVGFLRWRQKADESKSFRAPLLLLPVTLARRSASSPFYLTSHEDEVQFNSTLVQLLKKDFDCDLTAFESNLPMDDRGVDVPLVFTKIRQAVHDIPGFEVVEEAAIASFSFAKHLMWKDLVERVGQLEHNRVVRHLIHDPDKAFQTAGVGAIPKPVEIDRRYPPRDLVHPLPADSSQLSAVMAASEGHDFVIVGPPGTGKSQTIANIIAQCLAGGKTVLFVAEKTAALDVVYRRLRDHGLGDCCVELHSNKAERKRFLDQLETSWKNRSQADASSWDEINEQLKDYRDQLNEYVASIHHVEANGWTVYRAMGECVRGRSLNAPLLNWPASVRHDKKQYSELLGAVAELGRTYSAISPEVRSLPVMMTDWTVAGEAALLESCRQLEAAAESLTTAVRRLTETFSLPSREGISAAELPLLFRLAQELSRPIEIPDELFSPQRVVALNSRLTERKDLLQHHEQAKADLQAAIQAYCRALGLSGSAPITDAQKRPLYKLANELVSPQLPPAELVFHPEFERLAQALTERPALVQLREESLAALRARSFDAALIDRVPTNELQEQWHSAIVSIWPLSLTRKGAVSKRLQAYMGNKNSANPEVDLPLLAEYQAASTQLEENLKSLNLPPHLTAEVKANAQSLDKHVLAAWNLRKAIQDTGANIGVVAKVVGSSLKPLVAAVRKLFQPEQEANKKRAELKENLAKLELSPQLQAAVERDVSTLDVPIKTVLGIRSASAALGVSDTQLNVLLSAYQQTPAQVRQEVAGEFGRAAKSFHQAWSEYVKRAAMTPAANDSASIAQEAATTARTVLSNRPHLRMRAAWIEIQQRLRSLGLGMFIDALEQGTIAPKDMTARFELAYARWWLPTIVDQRKPIQKFQKIFHEGLIEQFRALDEKARRAAPLRVRSRVLHDLPPSDQVPRQSELGLLRHQMTLKRPSKSIREIISGLPGSFSKLAPCLLMSPLSIAQYLPVNQALFDVVIFDEASQIATWDAIGAIARGKQTIIVGDPKQLPPTNFFGRVDSDEDNSELEDHEKDLESILDEAGASGLPTLQLNWHYRSRHESLIAFSNWNYYGNNLVTFPAAESLDRGVSLRVIKDGIYDRGKSRTNRKEAEAIVAELVERMKRCLAKPPGQRLTYGVVTFNMQQQVLILDLIDDAQRKHPELEWFFSDDRIEPTVVKNLENVQGDERDVMMFSIAFGFDAAGKFPVDFGAINRDGGERRLNVAITRARQELAVYSSFQPEQLHAERSNARGVRDLKSFLEYADKGPEAMVARTEGSLGGFESPLEESVATALRDRGWIIDTQVGVSGFRIDLGVVHPDKAGAYLAGVECDGMTYHRSAMARDRDKTRQQVLENLGWSIVRVWSTDWWYATDQAIEALHSALCQLLKQSREMEKGEVLLDSDELTEVEAVATSEAFVDQVHKELPADPSEVRPQLISHSVAPADTAERRPNADLAPPDQPVSARLYFRRAEIADATSKQEAFFEERYSEELKAMALAILEVQGPILDDSLARDVAKVHGIYRTSAKVRQRVLDLLADVPATEEPVGRFLWSGAAPLALVPFRYAKMGDERRSVNEIAMPELLGLLQDHPDLVTSDDPALALARVIGLARLSSNARERLEKAIELKSQENS
ncbi:MAG: DUF3320 domain-containing protein [Planctomycetaceae bacterium]